MKHQHWADMYAEKMIRERGALAHYTCASGITPSGTVHIGNFREIISVALVVQALTDKGKTPRFIYSWDDFDVFRKVPQNIEGAQFEQYLRMPITDIPDPLRRASSYALAHEEAIEHLLSIFGIHPTYIYQSKEYRRGVYAEGIRKALEKREEIREILNQYRTHALSDEWWPISVFSTFSKKDTTTIIDWDGAWNVRYRCDETGNEETVDIRNTTEVKLLWRIDWPMRWAFEKVIFEPAGKDHHTQGGSFDTARDIARVVYEYPSPVTFQYGFVKVKGGTGKLSSSGGEIVSVGDVLEIYEPEIIRYLFVGTKPQSEFAISFDLDVIKIYEDYDRCERIYFGKEEVGEVRRHKETRIYELSQTKEVPSHMPMQVPIRHVCNLLQIHAGNIEATLEDIRREYGDIDAHITKLTTRMQCAWNWIQSYAPDDFRFSLRARDALDEISSIESAQEKEALHYLKSKLLASWDTISDKEINAHIYDAARSSSMEPVVFFKTLYRRLIAKEKGPRLGHFIHIVGKDNVEHYL